MTRPMPEPPEHDRCARPHRQLADERCSACYSPGWTLPKWLTDAECAAHYWQAEAYAFFLAASEDPDGQWVEWFDHKTTWHRFATHPHALEEA